MSFSTTDIQMGADLVIKAIGEDLQGFLKDPNPQIPRQSSTADNNRARESMQALARWQLQSNILVMNDQDRSYSIDPEAIAKLSDDQVQKGGALYKASVDTHLPIVGDLHRAGRADYVQYFSENHRSVDGMIEPPITRATEASMDAVAKSALAFVEAVDADPAKGAGLKGITRLDTEALTDSLADAGYLIPGENPERKEPLAEQTSRGTYEQKVAIFEQAAALSANLELPDSVRGFDAPTMAAKGLQASVEGAEIEELPVFGTGKRGQASVDSDLPPEAVSSVMMTMLLAAKVIQNSQMSTDIEDNDTEEPMVVMGQEFSTVDAEGNTNTRNDLFATFKAHVHHDIESGIVDVIARGANARTAHDFYIPDLADSTRATQDAAKVMHQFYRSAKALAGYEPDEDERIDGDSGARNLGGPHAQWDGAEDAKDGTETGLGDFDREIDFEEAEGEEQGATLSSNKKAELATERFARRKGIDLEPAEIKVPEKMVEALAKPIDEAVTIGLVQKMSKMTGREAVHGANDAAIFAGTKAASFGGYEDFMGAGLAPEASEDNFARDVYSFGQVSRRGEDFEHRLTKQGAVRVDPDRGLFKDLHYKTGAPSSAAKRVAAFVRDNMTQEDGTPNFAMRATLRKMADRPIIAGSQQEAEAWKAQSQAFVERENAEHKLRLEAASAKAGVWSVDLSRSALTRAIAVTEASGDVDTPFHVKIEKTGIKMARPDAPLITAPMGANVPDTITEAKTNRALGGMIAPAAMRGALEAMEKNETTARLVMHGEVPKGLTSQYSDQRQREAEMAKAAKPKGLEPHMPDMLG